MTRRSFAGLALGVGVCWASAVGAWEEPYAFKKMTREFTKEIILECNFEGALPPQSNLVEGTIEPELGTKGSQCLVSKGKEGIVAEFTCAPIGLGMSRFDVDLDFTGEDFGGFHVNMVCWDKAGNLFEERHVGGEWGWLGPKEWRHATWTVDIEVEKLHRVGIRIRQFSKDGYFYIDNLKVRRYTNAHLVQGQFVRDQLDADLKREGATSVSDLLGVKVALFDDRESFFDIKQIDPGRRYLLSFWNQRLHLGTTYKKQNYKPREFILGVWVEADTLRQAANRHGKGASADDKLKWMFDYLIKDVADHHFNTIWTNEQQKLPMLAKLAAEKNIQILYRHPGYNFIGEMIGRKDGVMPDKVKKSLEEDAARLAAIQKESKNILGWQLYRHVPRRYTDDHPPYGANLAKVRAFIQELCKQHGEVTIPLLEVYSDHPEVDQMQPPYSDLAIQNTWLRAYHDKRSGTYGPNHWGYWSDHGGRRWVEYALMARGINFLWWMPVSREYQKRNIDMKKGWVDPKLSGWEWDEQKQRWSGWFYCKPVPGQVRAFLWNAAAAGAKGVLLDEWGPGKIPANVTAKDLQDPKYADGAYRPEPLRLMDLGESDAWREAGLAAKEIRPYGKLIVDLTPFGAKGASTNQRWVCARKFCFYNGYNRFIVLANNRVTTKQVGEHDSSRNLEIDKETGQWAYMVGASGESAGRRETREEPTRTPRQPERVQRSERQPETGAKPTSEVERRRAEREKKERAAASEATEFKLTVESVRSGWYLWDCRTGQKVEGEQAKAGQDTCVYDMVLLPGQGAIYFIGTQQAFEREVVAKYGLGKEKVE